MANVNGEHEHADNPDFQGYEDVQLVGPFERWEVTLHGRKVPFLTATPQNGGTVTLHLDGRFALWDLPVADLHNVVTFVAHAIAIASGYTCHPGESFDEPIPSNPFQKMVGL